MFIAALRADGVHDDHGGRIMFVGRGDETILASKEEHNLGVVRRNSTHGTSLGTIVARHPQRMTPPRYNLK
jgi:hypothetical protein